MQAERRRYRILMVDDDPAACEIVRRGLAPHGYNVRTRNVSLGTLADIRANMPDVLLLDMSMPGLSGDKLLCLVREQFPQLKVVVYTAASAEALPVEAKRAHVVVRKGPPEKLAAVLRNLR